MRALRIAVVAAALLAATTGTARAQSLTNFREAIKKLDPQGDFVLKTEAEGSLAWVYVADAWYAAECFQRERIADNLRKLVAGYRGHSDCRKGPRRQDGS